MELEAERMNTPRALERQVSPPAAVRASNKVAPLRPPNSKFREADFCVRLSLFSFKLVWFTIVLVHVVCIGCFGIQSWLYIKIPLTYFASELKLYDVTMPVSNFRAVSICFGAIAAIHGLLLLQMLAKSVWYQTFTFGQATKHAEQPSDRSTLWFFRQMNWAFKAVFGQHGLLGIKGRYFETVHIVRETLETALQSSQAYFMSQVVPHESVIRFFVLVIVNNCWSTPIICHVLRYNPPFKRLICLVFDIVLDFISSVGIPVFLAIPYLKQYDVKATDFPYILYFNDYWLVNMIHEMRIVLISSWANLFCELAFSISLILSLQNIKRLIRPFPSQAHPQKVNTIRSSSIETFGQSSQINGWLHPIQQQQPGDLHPADDLKRLHEENSRFVRIMHVFMIIWGLVILVLHLRASFRPSSTHCAQQAWPWFGTKSGCTLLSINCNKTIDSIGNITELDAIMAGLSEQTLSYIVVRNCPYIEIPARIQTFPNLVGVKIYNSTLARWDTDAALSATHHPKIVFLFVVKTNMTQIPPGLLSREFPPKVSDIEFAWTNLTTLPDDLSEVWPDDGYIAFERGQFQSVPQELLRKPKAQVSMAGGDITSLPEEVFTNPLAARFWLSGNPIAALPDAHVPSKSINFMDFSNTKLAFLPSWVDELQNARLIAGGTPLCNRLKSKIAAGDTSSVGLDLAVAWAAYQRGILSCKTSGSYYYPYEAEAIQ